MTEGVIHKKEVKKCRTEHTCHNFKCPVIDIYWGRIRIGQPAIVITNEIINQSLGRTIFTKPKYYHIDCYDGETK